MDATSGETRWLRSDLSTTTVEATEGRVYFERGALDTATGETTWEVDESGELLGVAGNTVYFRYWDRASETESIAARDTATGEKRWQAEVTNQIVGTAATVDRLYVTSRTSVEDPSYTVYALSGTDGSVEWRSPAPARGTAQTTEYTNVEGRTITVSRNPYISTPAVDESRVYVLTRSYGESYFSGPAMSGDDPFDSHSTLYAFDRSSGEELWRFETPIQAEAAPTVTDETVYFAGRYKKTDAMYALDAETGTKRWMSGITNPGRILSPPSVVNDSLFLLVDELMGGAYLSKFEATECGESVPDEGTRTVKNDPMSTTNQSTTSTSGAPQSTSASANDVEPRTSRETRVANAASAASTSDSSVQSVREYGWRSPLAFVGGLGLSAGAYLTNSSPLKSDD